MRIDWVLPAPTEDELNLGFKTDYYTRLIGQGYERKFNITSEEFYDWIHHNYSSIFLTGEELPLNKYRKLIK